MDIFITVEIIIRHRKYRPVTINRVIFKYTNKHFYEKMGVRKQEPECPNWAFTYSCERKS